MIDLQNTKLVNITGSDQTKDNAAFETAEIDTVGFAALTIVCAFGNVPADVAALKVTESDTSGSGHADVPGLVVGTSKNADGDVSALPTAADGDGDIVVFDVDLRGRKRFIDLAATAGNGSGAATEMCAIGILGRPGIGCKSAAERGAAQILRS